jgi:hypothetical protein
MTIDGAAAAGLDEGGDIQSEEGVHVRLFAAHNRFAHLSEMIDGRPLLSEKLQFSRQHDLTATTWRKEGAPDDPVPVTIDLAAAFDRLKAN